ncbi:arylsulfatase A-like enzyme [Halanaerobium saccharolyticum]|uniref:Arylsulfatase A-like enzyme n=1 Tax=Halanaerobium saccharolyticum TaxID=43595 RepID=A0A4R7Z7G8_9FIRM|nr:sulfatase-like hydrolase/transferase [Halanaerobium saccharolyticum]RAK11721.1 arylsulfatase A-like enzyme [Halanaerobium saccharolyticum]TDW07562.1 arylsulfatase A-like enzyme [Halanaerobium saccharolyticum]TDX64483.1 arylsulfatase A-like enzyme [Halanaerobium saccharolyticum]
MSKPNLVIFIADQMRADSLSHLGNKASKTPNLDKIVQEDGVSFKNNYCQNTVCVPSRSSFLTGWYPHTKGHRTMHYLLEEDDPMLLKTLKNNGYNVQWIGRNDVIPADKSLDDYCNSYYSGYDKVSEEERKKSSKWKEKYRGENDSESFYSFLAGKSDKNIPFVQYDWNCINRALNFIDNYNDEQPFCIYISLIFPHPPYGAEEPWYSLIDRNKVRSPRPVPEDWDQKASMLKGIYDRQNLKNWNEDRFKELRAVYLGMVARVDHHFGMLVNKLKEKELYNNTSMIFFADHGDYTGDYGIVEKSQNTFEDPVSNVPLIIKPHKGIKVKPRVTKSLSELVDLSATVADLTNIELEHIQFGESVVPVLEGEEKHKDAVFAEGGRIHGETQAMEKGHGPESEYWPRLNTQEQEGPEHTKAVMIRMGKLKYIERLYEKNELYNLESDPDELNNLICSEDYQDQIIKFKARLLKFYMETADYVPDRKDKRY